MVLLLTVTFVGSAPLAPRDVFVPPVTYPHRGVVWYSGQRYNVTWDVSNPPKQITNLRGAVVLAKNRRLLLGKQYVPTESDWPLTLPEQDHYLADGFDIRDGIVEVKVPNVSTGDDYSVVVFGDSGNFGQTFSIKHHPFLA
ncbi:hypothetical protein AAF712_003146 [Marasmius tenuissimus]|uniref:Uncharacterized protein n=1 Tax=Marasmius tenuissimus TaxID=585030 RepID=A0ABR3A791_9AGAR